MMLFSFVLPLADIKFLIPPTANSGPMEALVAQPLIIAAALVIGLIAILLFVRSIPKRRHRPVSQPWILVDGSNVMHWKNETPQITTVLAVVRALEVRGFAPGVVFDANAGYKLADRYMNERDFARLLYLPENQIFVVPKGTQADPYLLRAARGFDARIVTRDRFRDWAEEHPEVKEPGFLIRGGYRASGELWLDEAVPVPDAAVQS
jgi:hypothetical protein